MSAIGHYWYISFQFHVVLFNWEGNIEMLFKNHRTSKFNFKRAYQLTFLWQAFPSVIPVLMFSYGMTACLEHMQKSHDHRHLGYPESTEKSIVKSILCTFIPSSPENLLKSHNLIDWSLLLVISWRASPLNYNRKYNYCNTFVGFFLVKYNSFFASKSQSFE